MSALASAWRALRRLIAPASVQSAATRLQAFEERFRDQWREGRRNSHLELRFAISKARRARRRALTLLLSQLNAEQRQTFRKFGYVPVTGGASGERYRIRVDRIANIDVLCADGSVKCRLCVFPAGDIPVYDVMAAQLLHLQDPASEPPLLRKANVFPAERKVVYSRSVWLT